MKRPMFKPKRSKRKGHKLQLLVLVVAVLIAARAALPHYIQQYVNRTLDRIPEYDGSIGDVDLALFRGAYSIEDVKLIKTSGKVPVPLIDARKVDFSILWSALLEGKVVGEIIADHARLNLVHGESKQSAQTRVDSEWLEVVKDLFPLRINRFEFRDSELHYRDFQSDPKVDVEIKNIELVGKDFSNTRSPTQGVPATIEADGKFEESAAVKLHSRVYPAAKVPTFDVDVSLTDVPLKRLNDFLRAYGNFDAEAGTFALYADFAAAQNKFAGSLKPIVRNASVLKVSEDTSNPLRYIWEGFVAFLAEIFQNQSKDQVATTISFSGTLDNPESSLWDTLLGILENAFVKALKPGTDSSISVDSLIKNPEKAAEVKNGK